MKIKTTTYVMLMYAAVFSLFSISCAQTTGITAERYALVIGISNYADPSINDLTYPVDDATSMKNLLVEQGWTVTLLTDSQATKSGIESTMGSFFSSMKADSTALIYYSGHGTLANDGLSGDAAIVPYDISYSTWSPLITPADLSSMIAEYIDTKNVILISDSCYSGGFVASSDSWDVISSPYDSWNGNTVSASSFLAMSDFGDLLAKNAAASGALAPIVISAAGSAEFSYEIDTLNGNAIDHGIFTYYLLQAATEGDANGDGYVTCTEAYTYAAKAVDQHWNSTYGGSDAFYPHISGGLRDLVLFTTGG